MFAALKQSLAGVGLLEFFPQGDSGEPGTLSQKSSMPKVQLWLWARTLSGKSRCSEWIPSNSSGKSQRAEAPGDGAEQDLLTCLTP